MGISAAQARLLALTARANLKPQGNNENKENIQENLFPNNQQQIEDLLKNNLQNNFKFFA